MPNYHVEYNTWNEYGYHVGESFFAFQILPENDDKQHLTSFNFQNSIKELYYITKNHYGFRQITFRTIKPFTKLSIELSCDVHVKKINPFEFNSLPLDEEMTMLDDINFKIDNSFFLQNSGLTNIPTSQVEKIWLKDGHESVFEYLCRLNALINSEFEYVTDVTDVQHSASEIFHTRKGVCQDFTHTFISMARRNKIPCRYVSGYLSQGQEFIGNLLMHAWAEALIPGYGWIGFDPTNNILRDHHYIKVCHGTDYSECGPIRGIIKGIGEQKTNYAVKVTQQ
jgi:hypothetical protein